MSYATFLNGREPTQLRGLQWLALSDVGDLLARVSTPDNGGGASQTWGTAGTAIPCKIEAIPNRTERSVSAGRINERSTHLIAVPAGTPVRSDHRFAIAARGTFEVTGVRQQTAEWVREFEVVELT